METLNNPECQEFQGGLVWGRGDKMCFLLHFPTRNVHRRIIDGQIIDIELPGNTELALNEHIRLMREFKDETR